ncbi:hypothetical protein DXG03_005539 [Asterophora parasitica]|uniref:Mitochondrial carrier domain-containing protein n=1 Tax=Asterophora parasitica TaxID=117018 RepID=A0A9P7G0A7_9AGAR|nr:hypothetical protein DXG03_005539 [Asterophora parasitica]
MQGTDALPPSSLPAPRPSNALTPLLGANTAAANSSIPKHTPTLNDTHPYRTTLSTIVNSYRANGWRVFYRGLAPTLIRAIPVNMVTFATFEAVVKALS